MELNNEFEVDEPIDSTWATLTDVERIAPCLPGAQLQEIEGDEYRGTVKVKVGPITAQYKGAATFVEQDDVNHKAVLQADGRDTRGAGNASALITAKAVAISETRTRVTVDTDLKVTGKVAQFGRGVMVDISGKLMKQFADNLNELLESDSGASTPDVEPARTNGTTPPETSAPAPTASASTDEPPKVRKIDMPEPEAVNLLDTAGAPIAKRAAPVLIVLLILFLLWRRKKS